MSKLTEVNASNFNNEVLSSTIPVIVKFTALWCMPCKAMEPILESVADEIKGRGSVVSLDIDETPEIASKYGVRSVPTLIVFKGGEVKNRLVGRSSKENVLKLIDVVESKSESTLGG